MNKLFVFALVALSANLASAGFLNFALYGQGLSDHDNGDSYDSYSEAVIPTDTEEVAYLKPHEQVFASFCTQARDDVKTFLTSQVNNGAAALFTAFFKGVGESGEQLMQVEKAAVDEAARAIKENVPAQPAPSSPQEAEQNVEENTEKVSLISNVSKGAKYVLNTVINTARSELAARLALVRSKFNADNFKEQMTDLCDSVSKDLKKSLSGKLNEFKAQAKSSAASLPNGAATVAAIDTVTADNVGCLTTGRINKVAQVCNFIQFAGPALLPILGY